MLSYKAHDMNYEIYLLQALTISFVFILPAYVRIGFLVRKLNQTEPHLSNFPAEAQAAQKKKIRERRMAKTLGWVVGVRNPSMLQLHLYLF